MNSLVTVFVFLIMILALIFAGAIWSTHGLKSQCAEYGTANHVTTKYVPSGCYVLDGAAGYLPTGTSITETHMDTSGPEESTPFDLTIFGWVLDAEGYWYKPVEDAPQAERAD